MEKIRLGGRLVSIMSDGIVTEANAILDTNLNKTQEEINAELKLDIQDAADNIRANITSVYRFRGSVDTYNDLKDINAENGDVYDVKSTGANYAFVGSICNIYSNMKDAGMFNSTLMLGDIFLDLNKTKLNIVNNDGMPFAVKVGTDVYDPSGTNILLGAWKKVSPTINNISRDKKMTVVTIFQNGDMVEDFSVEDVNTTGNGIAAIRVYNNSHGKTYRINESDVNNDMFYIDENTYLAVYNYNLDTNINDYGMLEDAIENRAVISFEKLGTRWDELGRDISVATLSNNGLMSALQVLNLEYLFNAKKEEEFAKLRIIASVNPEVIHNGTNNNVSISAYVEGEVTLGKWEVSEIDGHTIFGINGNGNPVSNHIETNSIPVNTAKTFVVSASTLDGRQLPIEYVAVKPGFVIYYGASTNISSDKFTRSELKTSVNGTYSFTSKYGDKAWMLIPADVLFNLNKVTLDGFTFPMQKQDRTFEISGIDYNIYVSGELKESSFELKIG